VKNQEKDQKCVKPAGVLDNEKGLWIAKFPSKSDNKDVGGWEMVVK
jgi:serine/threonine-protein kinase HipA